MKKLNKQDESNLPIWRRNFKTREDYEIARLKIVLALTERAISPYNIPSEDFLKAQAEKIRAEIAQIEAAKTDNSKNKPKKVVKKQKRR